MSGKLILAITRGPMTGKTVVFDEHDTFLFGRMPDCHVYLSDDHYVSRRHFILEVNPPDARIRDLGSLHGTYINGQKYGGRQKGETPTDGAKRQYPQIDLRHGDEIKVGKTTFHVEVQRSAPLPLSVHSSPLSHTRKQCQRCGKEVSAEMGADHAGHEGTYVCASCRQHAQSDPEGFLAELVMATQQQAQEKAPLNDYTVGNLLGYGGMGAVYLAWHKQTGQQVALKVMLSRVAIDNRAKEEFLREIEVTRTLQHPHIVQFLGCGAQGSTFYFFLEYCEEGTVMQLMDKRGGRLTLDEARPILLQALEGLAFIHARGFVHRDLKPPNILLRGGEGHSIAKVSDMGIAKSFEKAGFSGMTATGNYVGSYPFMPREQVTSFKYYQPASDVWAMGATYYLMLTGYFPRIQHAGQDAIDMVLSNEAVPIRQRNPQIPPKVAEVIDRSLLSNVHERYQNAGEMYEALAKALV